MNLWGKAEQKLGFTKHMKNSIVLIVLIMVPFINTALVFAAPVPTTLGYQGYFTTSGGTAVTGSAPVTVRIYDAATAGNLLFVENEGSTSITNGYFSLAIGSVGDVSATTSATAISDLAFDQPYYITVEIGAPYNTGEMTLSGGLRSALNAVPYAVTSYGAVTSSTSTGLTQAKGKLYYDTTLNQLFVNNGSSWQALGVAGAGITTLNGLVSLSQNFALGTSGNDIGISSGGSTHTFNIPNASSNARGVVSTTTQTFSGDKTFTGSTALATTTVSNLTATNANFTNSTSTNGFFSNVLSALTAVVSTLTGGSVTGGTVTATSSLVSNGTLTVSGATSLSTTTVSGLRITGPLTDGSNSTGTVGMVLQTTGTSTRWVATSSLGITGGGSSLTGGVFGYVSRWLNTSTLGTSTLLDDGVNAGINATSTNYSFVVQGKQGVNPLNVASSTGSSLFSVLSNGALSVGSSVDSSVYINGGSNSTTSLRNFSVGYQSMAKATTSANDNFAAGYQALYGSTTAPVTGSNNVAIGYSAMFSNTTGNGNNALGSYALTSNTSGISNNAFGTQALYSNTTGVGNNAIGNGALHANVGGNSNNAIGSSALYFNVSGTDNNALGNAALFSNTIGSNNSAMGNNALTLNNTGNNNIAFGYQSLRNNSSGNSNIAFGFQSGYGDGVAPDQQSIIDNYSGFIGYQASRAQTVASTTPLSNAWAIGYNAKVGSSNAIVLGSSVASDAVNVGIGSTTPGSVLSITGRGGVNPLTIASSSGATLFTILTNGNVGMGTTTPAYLLGVGGSFGVTGVSSLASTTVLGSFNGAGLTSCGNAGDKLLWANGTFTCGVDQVGAGGGISQLNGLSAGIQTFATSSSNGLDFNISSSVSTHTFSVGLQSGYSIPLTASTSQWNSLVNSALISLNAGPNIVISGTSTVSLNPAILTLSLTTGSFTATGTSNLATTTISKLTLSGALLDSVSATGTSGQVLLSTGTSTQWVSTSSLGISGGSGVSGGVVGYVTRFLNASTLGTSTILDNGIVAGVNATSSQTAFTVQGVSGVNPFNVASSTGASFFTVLANGNVGIGTTTGNSLLSVGGTLSVTGQTTLTTASATALTLSGNGVVGGTFSVAGLSTLAAVNANTILPNANLTYDLGSSASRFNNLYVGSVFATSSVLTNSTSTTLYSNTANFGSSIYLGGTQIVDSSRNLTNIGTITSGLINGQTISSAANFTGSVAVATTLGVTGTSTLATTTATTLTVTGKSTLANASATAISVSGNEDVAGSFTVLGQTSVNNASATALTVSGQTVLNTASTTVETANTLFSTLANIVTLNSSAAVNASGTLAVTGQSSFFNTLNLAADILPTTADARSLGTFANRFLNIFTVNSYATSTYTGTSTVYGNQTVGGTLSVTGQTTLTTASATALTLSGNGVVGGAFSVAGLSTLAAVNANTILPNANLTYDLGSNSARFNNLYVGSVFATSSVLTNSTSTTLYSNTANFGSSIYLGGTQIVDSSRNLTNIGTITSGLINGQTISSAANFTGSLAMNGAFTNTSSSNSYFTGNLGVGSTTPSRLLSLSKNSNGSNGAVISISNTTSNGSPALMFSTDQGNDVGQLFKYGSSVATYKTLTGNDFGFYNSSSGNISILNDYASGNINFTAGGASVAQMLISSNGNVGIGSSTPVYLLGVGGSFGVTGLTTLATTTVTNLTTTGTSTLATTTATTLTVTGKSTLANASATAISVSGNEDITGSLTVLSTSTLADVKANTLLIGSSTLFSLAKILLDTSMSNATGGATSSIAGIHGNYTFNPSAGGVQVGNRFVVNNTPTSVANTAVNQVIRSIDNTSLANTVRGLEVVSNAGSNTLGVNTGIRTTGATFGLQAFTSGLAGGISAPAAIYGESTGTTDGDILRLYSSTMTTAPYMAQIYQEISAYSGTGLYMDLGAGGGSFTGNFVNFQNNDVTKFIIDSNGKVGIGTSTLATTALTVAGDIRVGDSGTNGCLQGFGGATLTGTCTSDQRLKDNITDVPSVLDKFTQLRVVNFNWNQTAANVYGDAMNAVQTGYVAQNVESLFPELVHVNKEGYREVNYSALGLYAVEGVKELAQKNASTTATLSTLTSVLNVNHPLIVLSVATTTSNTVARFTNASGYCDINPATNGLTCTTDDSLRTNELLIDSTSTFPVTSTTTTTASTSLERLTALNVVTYTVGTASSTGLRLTDLKTLFPELVKVDPVTTKETFTMSDLVPFIVQSIKELRDSVISISTEIASFKHVFGTEELNAKTVNTDSLCVGEGSAKTCVTKTQLDELLRNNSVNNSTAQNSNNTQTSSSTENASTTVSVATSTDTTPPVITVNGNSPETVTVGSTYTDQGATAIDDVDGSVNVVVSGQVDTSVAGQYIITYTAVDKAGNNASTTRVVNVQ